MYSYKDKKKAIELFVRYDRSCAAAINELGYPCRQQFLSWYREFLENDGEVGRSALTPNYDHSMRRADDDYFFKHGQCTARTCRMLSYPIEYEDLRDWIDELEPAR
jgi:hypothetical protein